MAHAEDELDALTDADGPVGRTPTQILGELSDEQREAVNELLAHQAWSRHPVNLRLTLPVWPGRRYYLTVVAGRERRNPQRRKHERQRHPIFKPGNVWFLVGLLAVLYVISVLLLFTAQTTTPT